MLCPGHTAWRPDWWTYEMEPILRLVRTYREVSGIPYGKYSSELDCQFEEGGGFTIFSTLTRTPDFTGAWKDLRDPHLFVVVHARALSGPPHPLGPDLFVRAA